MGTCTDRNVHDCTDILKSVYLIFLSIVMLVVYLSALNICVDADWSDNPQLDKYANSECRFYFFDRTYEINGQGIQQGNMYVLYYVIIWGYILLVSCLSSLSVCMKCGTCPRKTLCLLLFIGVCTMICGDAISIIITYSHYDEALDKTTGREGDFITARLTYLGLNIVIMVMQIQIFFNTIYEMAGDRAGKESSAKVNPSSEDTVSLISTTHSPTV